MCGQILQAWLSITRARNFRTVCRSYLPLRHLSRPGHTLPGIGTNGKKGKPIMSVDDNRAIAPGDSLHSPTPSSENRTAEVTAHICSPCCEQVSSEQC